MDMDMFEEGTGLSSAFSFLDLVLASSDCKTSAHVWTVSPHHRRLSSPPSCQVATNVFNEMYIPLLHKYVPPMGSCPMPLLALGERLRLMPRGLGCESRLGAMVDAIWHDGVSALATDAVRAGVWHGVVGCRIAGRVARQRPVEEVLTRRIQSCWIDRARFFHDTAV